jgi:[protein-PII] uridylyltransferase
MHTLGVLEMLIPEFHGIDALVIRDSYHRYTVDEHTFVAIGNIHALATASHDWEKRFAGLLPEIDRLELLLLALLMHDTGKAIRGGDHTLHSMSLAESLFVRLDLDGEERATALLLIREHLTMSAALRRDIFDPETIRALAERLGSPMHLRMLCLLTYADIRAVHPDALTPWKAENLWQLFIATSNYLDRSVDEQRYHAGSDPGLLQRIVAQAPNQADTMRRFLEGLPQRYLQTRLPEQIRSHMELASRMDEEPVQITVRRARHLFELLLITHDRPLLFADVAGALSGLGMNIVKADAFANDAGVVVDSFLFADSFATLELNPSEFSRFTQSVLDVVACRLPVETLMYRRRHAMLAPVKLRIETDVSFDNDSSSHSTVMQVVAQDGPGLLRAIAAVIAQRGCDIRVALIDTEGEMAIDVFYLTLQGGKLDAAIQVDLGAELRTEIAALRQPVATTAHRSISPANIA